MARYAPNVETGRMWAFQDALLFKRRFIAERRKRLFAKPVGVAFALLCQADEPRGDDLSHNGWLARIVQRFARLLVSIAERFDRLRVKCGRTKHL